MHVIIYSDRLGFPKGYAATHYIHLVGKGLVASGAHCLLLLPKFSEVSENPINSAGKGIVDGIEYEYTTGTPIPPSDFIIRQCLKFRSSIFVRLRIIERFVRGKLDVLVLYSGSIKEFRRVYFICRILGIPIVLHTTEWQPGFTDYDEDKIIAYRKFYSRALKACDGFVVISQFLKDIIQEERNRLHLAQQVLIVPILVDPGTWTDIVPYRHPRPYLVFCAYLVDYLKEAHFVLNAFAAASLNSHDLIIVGKSNEETTKKILIEAERLGIMDKLVLKVDFVGEPELLALYAGAQALLLPLWNDDRSKARFPFKLGDYLMSGRPVVASGVGEVAKYLKDEESAFISMGYDVDHFSSRIKDAANSDQSGRVGIAGRDVALENFDYKKQGRRMYDFLVRMVELKKQYGNTGQPEI